MSTALNHGDEPEEETKRKIVDVSIFFTEQAEQNSAPSLQTVCIHHFWPGFFFILWRSHLERDAFVLDIFWVAPSLGGGDERRDGLWMWMQKVGLSTSLYFARNGVQGGVFGQIGESFIIYWQGVGRSRFWGTSGIVFCVAFCAFRRATSF